MNGHMSRFVSACGLLLVSTMLLDCAGGSEGGNGPGPGPGNGPTEPDFHGNLSELPAAIPATYLNGTPVIVAEATIGDLGGTLTGAAGTPVEGVVVTVPPGALSEPTRLSLGYDNGTFTNVEPGEQNIVIVLESSGATSFQEPLTVTYPFTDAVRVPVPYYIQPDGRLEIVAPLPLDRTAGRGGFTTWHASNFTFLNGDGTRYKPLFNQFWPDRDGFPIDNTAKVRYAEKGRCFGIATFSKWYKQKNLGWLAKDFLYEVSTRTGSDRKISGEEIIATRAHNSVQRSLSSLDLWDPNPEFIIAVKDALTRGAPGVVVGLANGDFGHAVLAIGYTDNQIALYDPNHPGVFKAIDYSLDPVTVSYGSYKSFGVFGNAEIRPEESFEHLLQDAQAAFHGENETKIEVTSHQHGQMMDSNTVTLEGRIESGQVLISALEARVTHDDGSRSGPVAVSMLPDDNTFKLPLTLERGGNVVRFSTRGYVAFLGTQDIPNAIYEGEGVLPDGLLLVLGGSCTCTLSGAINVTQACALTFMSDPQLGAYLMIEPVAGPLVNPKCGGSVWWSAPPSVGSYTFANVLDAFFDTNDAGQTGTWGGVSMQLDVTAVSAMSISGSLTVSMEPDVLNPNQSFVTLNASF